MDAHDMTAWRVTLDHTLASAGAALGVDQATIARYEAGQPIPRAIALACAALVNGLPPWSAPVGTVIERPRRGRPRKAE